MSRNIELKARCADLDEAARIAEALGAALEGVEWQRDTYFQVTSGRLKLRERRPEGQARENQLIGYHRADRPGSRGSDYTLVGVEDGEKTRSMLGSVLGVLGEVVKRRTVYWHDHVRIHLDAVEGLGTFIEFEAIVDDRCDEKSAGEKVQRLREPFKIDQAHVVGGSYVDL